MTFLAALRCDRVEAPWLLDGPIDGESFRLYVERVLVPTLRPSDILVMDNLGSHKGAAIRRAIRAAGARLFFLPKYSPDLNLIEKLFAKLKHWLRRAAARTQDAGLGHYEGRGWRGFHHHATLCIAAYGFLISERETIPPQEPAPPRSAKNLPFPKVIDPEAPPIRTERHVANSIATTRRRLSVAIVRALDRCPCCNAPRSQTADPPNL